MQDPERSNCFSTNRRELAAQSSSDSVVLIPSFYRNSRHPSRKSFAFSAVVTQIKARQKLRRHMIRVTWQPTGTVFDSFGSFP